MVIRNLAMSGLCKSLLLPLVALPSYEGKKLFVEAILNGTIDCFQKLNSHFQTQSKRTCGLTSLAMSLNALGIIPKRNLKGSWKLFEESTFDYYEPLEEVKARGLPFRRLVNLADHVGAKVEAFRTNESSIDDFRAHVMKSSAGDDCYIITNFHRAALSQMGGGHFSPIGGYHVERDMVLILDVARFHYPPYWVPIRLLWEAMDYVDSSGQHRGFIVVSRYEGVQYNCV